jgi:hypothetical protein
LTARHQHYSSVVGALEQQVAQMPPGAARDRDAAALAGIKSDFGQFSRLLQGPQAGGPQRFFGGAQDTIEMQRVSDRMRQSVADMSLSNPAVLSKIGRFDQRQAVSESMVAKMAQDQLNAVNRLPIETVPGRMEFLDNLKASSGGMKNDVKLASGEAAMQGRVLDTLGAALTGVGQAEAGSKPQVKHQIGSMLGPKMTETLGLDTRRPNEKLASKVNLAYGDLVHASPQGKKDFDVTPNPNAKGALGTEDFLGALDGGLAKKSHGLGLNVVKTGTQMAVGASPDLQLTGARPGERSKTQHAELAPETAAQLEQLRKRAGAPPNMAPLDRLSDVGRRAAEERRMGDLKVSLQQSFGSGITNQLAGADSLLNPRPQLAGQKANLLEATMGELMQGKTKQDMLDTISAARVEHQSVLGSQLGPAGGGRTATALNDMEQAINRFFDS